ncbi:hypothetical protein [Candidatus Enterococcus mansonii]|uniref:Uncharacterized protein n=1 Tax=Candidatus Enterococcus mansonii TaxID=1834181 RepID=A0A242CCV8_9ENTE|nr:hypothetical protein [Enterococcus sp. 4G2_DIV0659]OTO08041.1 hypothetical protein A5880_002311 [Enterococcus sp. 4G2_DIV0659]
MKKRSITIIALLVLIATVPLTACGNKEKEAEQKSTTKGKKFDKKEADVVSERTEVIDGQEMTIKTFNDGTEITLPKGINLDEVEMEAIN